MGDTQLGPGVLSGFQPNYYANLLPIGFPEARSMWRSGAGGYRFITRGTIPPDNDLMQEEFKNYPPFDLNDQITLKNIDGFSITNQPGGIAYDSQFIENANGSDFMVTPIKDFTSTYDGESIGAGSRTFSVLKVPHTSNNSRANQNADYTTAKNEGPFNGVSNFSVDTTKSVSSLDFFAACIE